MQRQTRKALIDGAIGGFIAGTAVAAWFFLMDAVAGAPLHTPETLATVILGGDGGASTTQLVVLYTLLHYGVFTGLGAVTGLVLTNFQVAPSLLLGALFGLGVLNSVYYVTLLITSRNILTVLPPLQVLGANLAGGMLLMAALHFLGRSPARLGWAVLRDHDLLTQGMVTGALGAIATAFWFFLLDIVTGQPLFTPAALGSVVFLGASSAADVQLNLGVIAGYTILHLGLFGVVGIGLVWLTQRIEQAPGFWLLGLMALIVLEGLVLGTLGVTSHWVLGSLGWWAIGVGNLCAVVAMGAWLWYSHPKLRHQFQGMEIQTKV